MKREINHCFDVTKEVCSRDPEKTMWPLMLPMVVLKLMVRKQDLREGLAQQRGC